MLNDDGLFVTWISPDGAVGREGTVKPGDRLLEVDGHWVMGSTLNEALAVGPVVHVVTASWMP